MTIMKLDQNWMMKDVNRAEKLPAIVPGDLYSDLLRNGKIEDPYYRDNELDALKLAENRYEYETVFFVDGTVTEKERVLLRFEGIDTLADVFFNDVFLGHADNMHRSWEYDVKEQIKEGTNTLRVVFASPTAFIREKYKEHRLDGTSDAMRGFP